MVIVRKNNRELTIDETQKEKYLADGYCEVVNGKVKFVKKEDPEVEKLKKENADLKKKNKELTEQLEDLEKKPKTKTKADPAEA